MLLQEIKTYHRRLFIIYFSLITLSCVGEEEIDETKNGIQEELSNSPENSLDSHCSEIGCLDSSSYSGNY